MTQYLLSHCRPEFQLMSFLGPFYSYFPSPVVEGSYPAPEHQKGPIYFIYMVLFPREPTALVVRDPQIQKVANLGTGAFGELERLGHILSPLQGRESWRTKVQGPFIFPQSSPFPLKGNPYISFLYRETSIHLWREFEKKIKYLAETSAFLLMPS